jgi:hypothetical protein
MVSYQEALAYARQRLYSLAPPVEHVWVLRNGKRWDQGWYFDCVLEPLRFIDTGQRFGGAPGFLVKDDGSIEGVGWSDPRHRIHAEPDAAPNGGSTMPPRNSRTTEGPLSLN